ncbi:CAP domain-containing protein [Lasiosphaeris hirsuta]|uniref:CAP domain-containing protein n=1 Tax=Lasiosphaeris hirsuta TaxID=260670 RepID=A0AA40DKU3_9PEZI|nr:CAP domain-containing protein [Lasiosphaeris hirsuta]
MRLTYHLLTLGTLSLALAHPSHAPFEPVEPPIATTTPTPDPSASPEFTSDTTFTSAILTSTNAIRSGHNAPPLAYNTSLAGFASAFLTLTNPSCAFRHSGGPYGENIALGCADARGCVELWGAERAAYDFAAPGFAQATGHFTQLVWRATTDVGCARRWCGGGKGWFLVCEYWPRGNVAGLFGEQVQAAVVGSGGVGGLRREGWWWVGLVWIWWWVGLHRG